MELLIHVDINNNAIGEIPKMEAHQKGILHRAFSIFIFDKEGKWLLQKRAENKYHSGGLWTNACCGHPLQGEETAEAAKQRLLYEMGISCDLKNIFDFTYRAQLDNGLIEHEYDQVHIGFSENDPVLNPDEVSQWRSVSFHELRKEIMKDEMQFTEWFKMIYLRVNEYYIKNYMQ